MIVNVSVSRWAMCYCVVHQHKRLQYFPLRLNAFVCTTSLVNCVIYFDRYNFCICRLQNFSTDPTSVYEVTLVVYFTNVLSFETFRWKIYLSRSFALKQTQMVFKINTVSTSISNYLSGYWANLGALAYFSMAQDIMYIYPLQSQVTSFIISVRNKLPTVNSHLTNSWRFKKLSLLQPKPLVRTTADSILFDPF